ncbi:hypothetical protein BGZ63DRAFT_391565 [Mariannaea sp. PMI_226]|nr:hypothetical protein BGZ63DRAFT_391565 [Mariannaea sp. PMI_226]
MSTQKAPNAGTKVDLGQNAPVIQEGVGKVSSESLANESVHEGDGFATNRDVHSENKPESEQTSRVSYAAKASEANTQSDSSEPTYASKARETTQPTSSSGTENAQSYDGKAPTYVNNQYERDPSGPHGKNLHEGGWDNSKAEDGLKKALNSEPGSTDDPSRLAEQQFQLKQAATGRDAGPREESVKTKTAYDALGSEVSS